MTKIISHSYADADAKKEQAARRARKTGKPVPIYAKMRGSWTHFELAILPDGSELWGGGGVAALKAAGVEF